MATTTLTAITDGWINANAATAVNANSTYVATGYFSTPQTNRGLLMFDISSLGSGWTVNSATLKLTVSTNFLGTSHTLNVYRLRRKVVKGNSNGTVTESASWNNYNQASSLAWTTAGAGSTADDRDGTAIGSASITSATSGTISITLTASMVQEWLSDTWPNQGLILVASNESNTTLVRWRSRTDATASYRPQLVIDYTPSTATLLTNLEGYWTLDNNSYLDASGKGRTLTPHNTPTQVTGLIGNATHFVPASSQWLSSSDAALKPGNTDWTWCGWIKLEDKTDFYNIAGNRGADNRGWKLFYHKQTVLDYFVFQFNNSDNLGDPTIIDTVGYRGGNPATNTWIFAACRHDSVRKFGHLFINGNPPDSGSHPAGEQGYCRYEGTPVVSSADYTLAVADNAAYFHKGDLDEIGFWSRWLSDAEILSLYNGGSGLTYPFGISTFQAAWSARRNILIGGGM